MQFCQLEGTTVFFTWISLVKVNVQGSRIENNIKGRFGNVIIHDKVAAEISVRTVFVSYYCC